MDIITEIAAYSLLHALQTAASPALNELAANATLRAAARRVELTAPRLPSWAPPESPEETLTRAIRYTLLRALTLAAAPTIVELSRAVEKEQLTVPAACRRLQAALPDFSTLAADVAAQLDAPETIHASCNQYKHDPGCNRGTTREHKTRSRKKKYSNLQTSAKDKDTSTDEPSSLKVSAPTTSYRDVRRALAPAAELYGIRKRGSVAPGMKEEEEFFISKGTIKELLAGEHVRRSADKPSHFTAAANIQILWERSRPFSMERDRYHPYEKSDIEWVHKRVADLNIAGKKYKVEITAKEFKRGTPPRILYQVKTEKEEGR